MDSRVGDDFEARAEWTEILERHSWLIDKELSNGEVRWTRPGKDGGTSATTGHNAGLHVFTDSSEAAPFEAGKNYSKFEAFTLLNHGGRYKDAVKVLVQLGYGRYLDNDGEVKQNPPPPGWKREAGVADVGNMWAGSGGTSGNPGTFPSSPKVQPSLVGRVKGADDDESEPVEVTLWPDPPDDTAFYGVFGQIVRSIEPNTECDPLALLSHLVISFGNVIGRSAYIQVEATRHHLNEFAVNVGRSAMGRKGTAADWAKEIYNRVDGVWTADRIQAGLSSGEGLISAVRDPIETRSPIRQKGKIVDWQMVVTDAGITDKRLLVLETEFGGALRALEREGNKLSALIRLAWDSGALKTLTKIPHKASDAHISILGHITIDELRHLLSCIDVVNGFANRFLWFAVRRQKSLPFGGNIPDLKTQGDSLSVVVEHARTVTRIGWTDECVISGGPCMTSWPAWFPPVHSGRS